ncbi:hypothetical protein V8E36_008507 [Tilletia maclaganii]
MRPQQKHHQASSVAQLATLLLAASTGLTSATPVHKSKQDLVLQRRSAGPQLSHHVDRRQVASQITSANSTASVAAACDCGFIDLTEGADPTQVWNSLFKADFVNMKTKELGNGFRFMRNAVQRVNTATARAFDPKNAGLCNDGLCLYVNPSSNQEVPSAGVFTKDTGYHFGNYYAEIKIPPSAGTVSAFYVYKNDTNEVDMEFNNPSASANLSIKNTVKPQIYTGTQADPSTYKKTYMPEGSDWASDFHTWSFQWNPTYVSYGLDGVYDNVINVNVPQAPGVVSFSHWSDGNPNYSGGPPTEATILTFRRTWAFWNDTRASMPCKVASSPCKLDARVPTGSTEDATSGAAAQMLAAAGRVGLPMLVAITVSIAFLSFA